MKRFIALFIFLYFAFPSLLKAQCDILPSFNFSQYCDSVAFTNTTNYGSHTMDSILWSFGDGSTSMQNINTGHTYTVENTYTVSLTVYYDGSCTSSKDTNIYFYHSPIQPLTITKACFDSATLITAVVDTVFLADTSVYPVSQYWELGNNIYEINDFDTIHTFPGYGLYPIHFLSKNSSNCLDTIAETVEIANVVAYSIDTICQGETTYFFDESTTASNDYIESWLWDFGDGIQSTLASPTHVYADKGQYIVNLEISTQQGCVAAKDTTISLFTTPMNVSFDNGCIDSLVQIIGTADTVFVTGGGSIDPIHFFWELGDNNFTLGDQDTSAVFPGAGLFPVNFMTENSNHCFHTISDTVKISPIHLSFIIDTLCKNKAATFISTATSPYDTIGAWLWKFGDGNQSSLEMPDHIYADTGAYKVELTVATLQGCLVSTDSNIYIYRNPISIQYSNACMNDTAVISGLAEPVVIDENTSITPFRYFWELGDNNYLENDSDTLHTFPGEGFFPIHFTLENSQHCYDTISDTIKIMPIDVEFYVDTMCLGSVSKFYDSTISLYDPIIAHLWQFGDGGQSVIPSPNHIYSTFGEFNASLTITTQQGCVVSDTGIAKVSPMPTFETITITNRCSPSKVKFEVELNDTIDYGIQNIIWKVDQNIDTTIQAYHYSNVEYVGSHKVIVLFQSSACNKTAERAFFTYPTPISDFNWNENENSIRGNIKFINKTISDTDLTYLWEFSDGDYSFLSDPVKRFEEDQIYPVQFITKNKYNCFDTITKDVAVHLFGLEIPTALSPTNDDIEISTFKPKGYKLATYKIEVFNNKGDILWSSSALDENGSPTESWDGTYQGVMQPIGTYYWRAEAIYENGDRWKGSTINSETPQRTGVIHLID